MTKKPKAKQPSIAALLAKANHIHPPTQPNGFQFDAAKKVADPKLRTLPSYVHNPRKSKKSVVASNTVQGPASIVELSRALEVDGKGGPQLMYEWVYNNIEWEPGWGVYKGALGCLMDGMGNSFDQSLLLANLLREAGYTANIIQGAIRLYEEDYQDWWGVADIWAAASYCGNQYIPIVTEPTWDEGEEAFYMDIKHVWVEWEDGETSYFFDPSLKSYDRTAGLSSNDLATALGYNASTFMSNASSGATIDGSGNFVQKMNRGNIRSDLTTFTSNLVDYINTNVVGSAPEGTATVDDLLGGQKIIPATIPLLQTSLPYQMPEDEPNVWTGDVPSTYKPTLQIQLVNQDNPNTIDIDWDTTSDELAGKRLTLWYDGSDVPSLYLDGVNVGTGVAQDPFGFASWLIVTVTHPAYDASEYPVSWQQFYQTTWQWNQAGITANGPGYYLIGNSWGNHGRGQMTHHQTQLAANVAAGGSATDEDILGERLAVTWWNWSTQNSRVVDLVNRLRRCHTMYNHQIGIVSWNLWGAGAIATDIGGVSVSSTNFDNDVTQTPPNDRVIAMHGVALEAAACAQVTGLSPGISTTTVIDEAARTVRATIGGSATASDVVNIIVNDSGLPGGTETVPYTVQGGDTLADIAAGLEAAINSNTDLQDIGVSATVDGAVVALYSQSANETTYSQSTSGGATATVTLAYDKIYKGTSSNWNTGANIESILVGNGYNSGDMSNLYSAWLQWGYRTVLADHPDQVLGDWTGWGNWVYPDAGAFGFILGGYKGGGGQPGTPDSGPASSGGDITSNGPPADNPGNNPGGQEQGGDPLGFFSGDFFYTREDLSVGSGAFPYKLAFRRFYNSSSQYLNGPLGRGWTHNFMNTARVSSNGLLAMGDLSAIQGAATIAELFVANDIASDTTFSVSKLVTMTLADKWWIDQLVDNTVVVSTSTDSKVFIKLPDGSYVQPVNNAAELSVNSNLFRVTTPQQVEYNYDSSGNLSTIVFPNGVTVTLTYSTGKLISISNGMDRTINLNYTGDLITSVDDDNGRVVSYTFDGDDNLTEFENTLAKTWTYEYDQPGRMTEYFLPAYPMTAFNTNEYDSLSRVKTQKNARNQTWNYYFAGSRSSEVDPLDNEHARYFNRLGKVIRDINALGDETTHEYDGLNRRILTTMPEGNQFGWEYDLKNNVLTETRVPKSGSGLSNIVQSWTYHATFNKPTTFVDGNSNTWTWDYDAITGDLLSVVKPAIGGVNPTSQMHWNARGQMLSAIDETGIQTQFNYDGTKEELLSIVVNTNWSATIGGSVTTSDVLTITAYDAGLGGGQESVSYIVQGGDSLEDIAAGLADAVNGNNDLAALGILAYVNGTIISLSTAAGNTTTFTQSTSGGATETITLTAGLELTTSLAYNNAGDVNSLTDPNGSETEFVFDNERRLTQRIAPSPFGYLTNVGYDDTGNITSVQRQKDNTPTWQTYSLTYSATNKRLTAVDPASNATTWTYDGKDRVETITDAENREWEYAYDELDRIYQITDPTDTITDTRTYTPNGLLASITDARSNTTEYTYDGLDRPDEIIYADSTFEQFETYDDNGNVLSYLMRSGDAITNVFDDLNRLSTKSPDNQPTVTYVYDLAGRLIEASKPTSMGDPSSGALQFFFDSAGRFFQEKYPDGKTVTHELDANGNRTKTTWPDSYYVTRVFDELNRLTDVKLNGSMSSALQFDYDFLSRRTTLTYGNSAVVNYGFEDNNDMTSLEHVYNGSASVTFTYGYNDAHQETSRSIDDGSYMWHPSAGGTTTYGTADSVNKYPTIGGNSLTYDGNKNLTGDGTWTWSYDTENHLLSASKTGVSASMVYDALHRQSQKTVGSAKTRYIYSDWQRIADYDGVGGSLQNRYVYGTGLDEPLISVSNGGTLTYLHHDKMGSIVSTTNSGGTVTNTNAFGPFGEIGTLNGTSFGFTGQRHDTELELIYFKNRYYSSSIGRFLQPDSMGYTGKDYNLYSYVSNSPLNNVDPLGFCEVGANANGDEDDGGLIHIPDEKPGHGQLDLPKDERELIERYLDAFHLGIQFTLLFIGLIKPTIFPLLAVASLFVYGYYHPALEHVRAWAESTVTKMFFSLVNLLTQILPPTIAGRSVIAILGAIVLGLSWLWLGQTSHVFQMACTGAFISLVGTLVLVPMQNGGPPKIGGGSGGGGNDDPPGQIGG